MRRLALIVCSVFSIGLSHAEEISRAQVYRQAAAMSLLGKQMFFDPSLSASGKMSCASCHSPEHAFGPADGLAVQAGGVDLHQPGRRAVPSLMYLQDVPQFTEHYFENEDEADESIDNGPTGGLTWDGRVDRGADQARIPLLSSFEMANRSLDAVVAMVRSATYADEMRRVFGSNLFGNVTQTFAAVLKCLEVFEQDYRTFYPYSSKYDAWLSGRAELTPREARGLAAFKDPQKGNCSHCHISERGLDGTPPQFTDYGLIALGVPRNPTIPANAEPNFYDLGMCGPDRTDMRDHPDYCGRFMTPTLRNVATRHVFFHNGVFHTLREVVVFYAERDTNPAKWYPRASDGNIHKYDDLPARYQSNVNVEPPFDRQRGDKPALSSTDVEDIIASLQILTDGYSGEASSVESGRRTAQFRH